MARTEVEKLERKKFFDLELLDEIGHKLREFGFSYVTIDALGYRTGSMNEVLTEAEKQ